MGYKNSCFFKRSINRINKGKINRIYTCPKCIFLNQYRTINFAVKATVKLCSESAVSYLQDAPTFRCTKNLPSSGSIKYIVDAARYIDLSVAVRVGSWCWWTLCCPRRVGLAHSTILYTQSAKVKLQNVRQLIHPKPNVHDTRT